MTSAIQTIRLSETQNLHILAISILVMSTYPLAGEIVFLNLRNKRQNLSNSQIWYFLYSVHAKLYYIIPMKEIHCNYCKY
jgi:hypothetical protein